MTDGGGGRQGGSGRRPGELVLSEPTHMTMILTHSLDPPGLITSH